MKNKQDITVLLFRFVAAVSACIRILKEGVQKGHFTLFFRKIALDYKRITNEESLEKRFFGHPLNKVSSLRDLPVIAGILRMRLRTKYTDGDCSLAITYPAQSRRDDTLLTVYFSIRTWGTWKIPIEKQRTDDILLFGSASSPLPAVCRPHCLQCVVPTACSASSPLPAVCRPHCRQCAVHTGIYYHVQALKGL
jgi:hypothetical protein